MDCAGRAQRRRRFRAYRVALTIKPARCVPKRYRAALATAVHSGASVKLRPPRSRAAHTARGLDQTFPGTFFKFHPLTCQELTARNQNQPKKAPS